MKIIPVKLRGVKASAPMLVDDEDHEWLSKSSWNLTEEGYASAFIKGEFCLAHRKILNAKKGQITDHRDENKINNQKSNLRFCTRQDNAANRGKNKNNKSGFKGVSYGPDQKKWRAIISRDGKRYHLGYFSTPELAHEAYRKAALKLNGEFAKW